MSDRPQIWALLSEIEATQSHVAELACLGIPVYMMCIPGGLGRTDASTVKIRVQ